LRGEEREITVFFSDIRGFTDFSHGRSPLDVVRLLNHYFGIVVPIIERQGGIVNQYIGDGLMVIFGAPARQPDHAHRAIVAAVQVIEELHRRQVEWAAMGQPEFRIGIGIHTGKAVVGTIGSPRRMDYTAIGDVVNTASRIESANKAFGSEILVSEATLAQTPDPIARHLRGLGDPLRPEMKGISRELLVYRIDASPELRQILQVS
jgi:adenylate cyclase